MATVSSITNHHFDLKSSDFLLSITILLTVFFSIKIILEWRRSPPGPWGIPLFGHMPFLGSRPLNKFKEYQEKYGDVFLLRFGSWPTVIINGLDTVKSTLTHDSDSFAARPPFFSIKSLNDMKGLTFSNFDERYLLHRKISSSVIREIGSTNNSGLEEIIQDEANLLVSSFMHYKGKPFNPSDLIYTATGSITYQFCYGKGENIRDDPAFLKIMKDQGSIVEFFSAGSYFDNLPWLRYIFPGRFKRFLDFIDNFRKARNENGAEMIKTFHPGHSRHAMDGFLNACLKYNITETPNEVGLTKSQLVDTLQDFFAAGFETTASTLRWVFLYLAEYQDIQIKIQKEIDEKIGRNKIISLKDRRVLSYTEAVILEIMRIAPVVPLGLPHITTTDVIVKNTKIAKGTVVYFNIFSVMYDEFWGNPDEFQPERFLDDNGSLIKEKVDNVLAFSAGRRVCIGKLIAQAEVFYLVTTLLQNCKLYKPEHEKYDFEGEQGASYSPKGYKICVEAR
ncbi:cytochrome P450 1A1-like [Saccostrea echinata]|uniref:cytochrome P450 1A1-like n=1 Tax=Saccostrea echinata TaxID=191078 RepID=UPI002A83077F|nr:cytochrome P450 1A1-like [Saccostrea echinata]XP_061187528.1 cytochrome P450 1A1-like [Saccostrea echinata]